MTVSTTSTRNITDGNDVTTVFAYDFKIFVATDLIVTLYDSSNVGTVQTKDVDYTLDTITETGGQITMTTPPATGEQLLRERLVPFLQEVDYAEQDPFAAEIQEGAFDRATMLAQQAQTTAEQGIRVSGAGAENPDYEIDPPVAGQYVRGNAAADGWENATLTGLGVISIPVSVSEGGTNATDVATARTNLGLGSAAVLDTGTGAGEAPTNADLGSSSLVDAGTGASEMVQLDANSRLPAVSARNLTENIGPVMVAEIEFTGVAGNWSGSGWAQYENLFVELLNVSVDTAQIEIYMGLFADGTRYSVNGTTGQFYSYINWRTTGLDIESSRKAADDIQLTPTAWNGDDASGKNLSLGLFIRNHNLNDFASGTKAYPTVEINTGGGTYFSTADQFTTSGGHGQLNQAKVVDGIEIYTENAALYNFEGGFIRVWGWNGPSFR